MPQFLQRDPLEEISMLMRFARWQLTLALVCAAAVLSHVERAAAFCGFYVTGADSNLYANATMVVLMRDGTRTVLSMQNNYQGPPDAFALVIPVPVVLQKENVKVIPKEVFQHVDALGAPRLVEYWETNPCASLVSDAATRGMANSAPASAAAGAPAGAAPAVRVEAQFAVGEYDVVVLSADDSSALNTWLLDNKYNIPAGAEPVLAPYVASGMKFFVAKVDPTRVTFQGNQAALSPLRFHYDTPDFSLPVRLGLLNSQGSQDLIVNILGTSRYEVSNYPNITVPTNIRVQDGVRDSFASFYEALFSKVLEKHPKAVVTEYSWASGSCDPCPTPPLSQQDLMTFGGDVLLPDPAQPGNSNGTGAVASTLSPYNVTLTRLHARYTKDMLGEDLVFKTALGILGGRGIPDTSGNMDQSVTQISGLSNFQGRYVILHPWEQELTCQSPRRGFWGGPSGQQGSAPQARAASNTALLGMAPVAGDLPALLAESVPSIAVNATTPLDPLKSPTVSGGAGGKGAGGSKAAPRDGQTVSRGGSGAVTNRSASAGSSADSARGTLGRDIMTPEPAQRSSGGCAVAASQAGDVLGLGSALLGVLWLAGRRRTRRGHR